MDLLEIKNVTKKYGKKEVLKDINLSIKSGKIIGLLGKNGTGKTTLIKIIEVDEVKSILEQKWILPLITAIISSPDAVLKQHTDSIVKLVDKYGTTLTDVEKDIRETEKMLVEMMSGLVASDFDKTGIDGFISLLGGKKNE